MTEKAWIRSVVVMLLGVTASVSLLAAPSVGAGAGEIRGVVVDELGEPLAGTQVRIYSHADEMPWSVTYFGATETDAEGRYVLPDLPDETYYLAFYGPTGYTSELYDDVPWFHPPSYGISHNYISLDGVTGVVVSGSETVVVDEDLLPWATVSGTVRDSGGEPISGVEVLTGSPDPLPVTGTDGSWTLRMHPGEVDIDFRHPDFFDTYWPGVTDFLEREPFVVPPEGRADADVVMLRPASLSGRIVNDAGAGVAAARVELGEERPDGSWSWNVRAADVDGAYEFGGLLPGTYRIAVTAKGYLGREYGGEPYGFDTPRTWSTIEVDEGAAEQGYDVVMRRGAVLDPSISGPKGAVDPEESWVRVCHPEGHPQAGACLQSGDTLTLPGIPPGTYEVAFFSQGLVPECWRDRYSEDCDLVTLDYGQRWEPRVRLDRERLVVADRPTVDGSPRVGNTLTAVLGEVRPGDARARYQWLRDGDPIAGADARRYDVRRADRRSELVVRVLLTARGYRDLTVRSKPLEVR